MALFYKESTKKILEIRNRIFVENGIPQLLKNGFEKSPFSTSWFGKDDLGGFSYELCKLNSNFHLVMIKTYIIAGENWIQIFVNVFQPYPKLESLDQLKGLKGLSYGVPPDSNTRMRLHVDDRKGPPIAYLFAGQHKLQSYYTKGGIDRSIRKLSKLIEVDMLNIEHFIRRWYETHERPLKTNWEGIPIG